MTLRSATLSDTALRKIRSFVRKDRRYEIGGPMVGYVTDSADLFIEDVEGPGPRGVCLPCKVTIDGQHSQLFCDEAHAESEGKWDYVGDWHCHPGVSMSPSGGDCQAMRLMAGTVGLTTNPVSLIYSRALRCYRIYEWNGNGEGLILIPRRFKKRWFGSGSS